MRRTKIVCTLGPASNNESIISEMLKNGLNVARLNFSHGSYYEHAKTIDTFRKVRDEMKVPAAIMLDTKGPEIRIKNIKDGQTVLADGQKFILTSDDCEGNSEKVTITYPELCKQIKPGITVLIDDGKIILKTVETNDSEIICEVLEGGTLLSNKSINIPNFHIDMPYLSEKDEQDSLCL